MSSSQSQGLPPVDADQRFAAVVDAFVRRPGVTPPSDETGARRTFGSNGLKVNGKIFAMLVRGQLVVKLPRQRVEALVTDGEGQRFDPGHGRLMKEWLTLEPTAGQSWPALAEEALAFVAAGR